MKSSDVVKAAATLRTLENAERYIKAFEKYHVTGIVINSEGEMDFNEIQLIKGRSGTGSVNSMGFPDRLAELMNDALWTFLQEQKDEATTTLTALGVTLD